MIVVLCSGGVDSALLAWWAHQAGELVGLVWANYNQPAALQEWRAVDRIASLLRAPLHEVPLTTVSTGPMQDRTGAPGPRLVPVRNLLLIAHAANQAASLGAHEVHIGAIADDHEAYPDCRPSYLGQAALLTMPFGVNVRAPLITWTKPMIIREARRLGLLEHTWSCYTPTGPEFDRPCGTCNSCRSRIEAGG